MEKLTQRDYEVLNFIKCYINLHGYAPSYEEIGEGTHIKSKSSVHDYMKKLFSVGVIETDHPGSPSAIRVVRIAT